MNVSLIIIADEEFGIGKDNGTPWYFLAHQEYFEQLVRGHPVVMGRHTYESRGPVSHNVTMVVTNNTEYDTNKAGVLVDTDLHMAIERCKWIDQSDDIEIFIVGGGELFEHCLVDGLANKIYLTHISRESYGCNVFFQDQYLRNEFNESHRTVRYPDKDNNQRLEFIVYNRRRGNQPKDKKKTQ